MRDHLILFGANDMGGLMLKKLGQLKFPAYRVSRTRPLILVRLGSVFMLAHDIDHAFTADRSSRQRAIELDEISSANIIGAKVARSNDRLALEFDDICLTILLSP